MRRVMLALAVGFVIFPMKEIAAQWTQAAPLGNASVNSFCVNGNLFFAGTSKGIYRSTDDGATWTATDTDPVRITGRLAMLGGSLFVGDWTGVHRSTDFGASWAAVNSGLTNLYIDVLAVGGNYLYAGTAGMGAPNCGVYRSSDGGNNWSYASVGLENNSWIHAIVASDSTVFTSAVYPMFGGSMVSGGVYRSTDYGSSWTAVNSGMINRNVGPLAIVPVNRQSGPDLFVGNMLSPNGHQPNGAYLSTNNGTSWTLANHGIETATVKCFASYGRSVFALADGIFLTTNSGTDWTPVDLAGFTSTSISTITVAGSNLLAGSDGAGIWKRSLSEITSASGPTPGLPTVTVLRQNFPNPFNPGTTISYSIERSGVVILRVFDLLGNEVATLVNRHESAGDHAVQFDGNGLPTGVYIYRIEVAGAAKSKKLLLVH
jgi:hypothetical protein